MNSRRKGKVGEREFASLLRENGFDARRGQQFSGGAESPDVVSPALSWLHFEVKRVQNLNLTDACVQAIGDCGGKPWVVAHRRNHAPWLITMSAETFFALVRGELPPSDFKSQIWLPKPASIQVPSETQSLRDTRSDFKGPSGSNENKTQNNNAPMPNGTENKVESKTYESSPTINS